MIKQLACSVLILTFNLILISCEKTHTDSTTTAAQITIHNAGTLNFNDTQIDKYINNIGQEELNPFNMEDYDPTDTAKPITEYAYATAGNKIEIFHVESSGVLTIVDSISPNGIASSARISSIAIAPNNQFVYATIKDGSDDKIFMLRLNTVNGRLTPLSTSLISTKKSGSSSIVVSKSSQLVYVTSIQSICTYRVDINGILSQTPSCINPTIDKVNYAPYSQIILTPNAKYAHIIAGTTKNTLLMFKRESTDGTLSLLRSKPYLSIPSNSLDLSIPESGRFLYTALKNNDAVGTYQIDAKTGIVSSLPNQLNIGTGSEPHAVAITPNRKYAYVTNYHDNTISQFKVNTDGTLTALNIATVITTGKPNQIMIDKMGKFVYVSTADKYILQYKIDYTTGNLYPLAPNYAPLGESASSLAITNLASLHMTVASPIDPYDVPLDEEYVVEASGGVSESSANPSNITACQIDESQALDEYATKQVHASSTTCPSGYSPVNIWAIHMITSTLMSIRLKDALANHKVILYIKGLLAADGVSPYPDKEIEVDTTDSISKITMPINGSTYAAPDTEIEAVFTEDIIPNSTKNEIAITEFTKTGEERYTVYSLNEAGQVVGNKERITPHTPFTPGSRIEVRASAQTDPLVLVAMGTATIREESHKLIIYEAANRDAAGNPHGYNGNLGTLEGADIKCNSAQNKPTNRQNARFSAMIASLDIVDGFEIEVPQITRHACAQLNPPEVTAVFCEEGRGRYNWVLKENQTYYNKSEQLLGTTDERAIFPNENPLITPIRADNDLGGFHPFTGMTPDWQGDRANCTEWTSAREIPEDPPYSILGLGRIGLADATNIWDVISDQTLWDPMPPDDVRCSEGHHTIYCAEQ